MRPMFCTVSFQTAPNLLLVTFIAREFLQCAQTSLSQRAQSSRKIAREGSAVRLTPAVRRTVPREPFAEHDRESLQSWAGVKLLASRVVHAPRRRSPEHELQPRPRSATSATWVKRKGATPFCRCQAWLALIQGTLKSFKGLEEGKTFFFYENAEQVSRVVGDTPSPCGHNFIGFGPRFGAFLAESQFFFFSETRRQTLDISSRRRAVWTFVLCLSSRCLDDSLSSSCLVSHVFFPLVVP